MKTKVCPKCSRRKSVEDFYPAKGKPGGRSWQCSECERAYQRQRRKQRSPKDRAEYLKQREEDSRRLKEEIIQHYGGKCACCGEPELVFLDIDHVRGGGKSHRKIVGFGNKFYRWLKKQGWPKGYQVLCRNCNWSKYVNGVGPHKEKNNG